MLAVARLCRGVVYRALMLGGLEQEEQSRQRQRG